MKIKKILMYLLLPALLLTLFACGGEKPTPTPKPTPKPDENPKPSKVEYSVKFFDGQTLLADNTVEKTILLTYLLHLQKKDMSLKVVSR